MSIIYCHNYGAWENEDKKKIITKIKFKKCLFVQVKVTEIFDVTQTDPSLLIADEQGVDYR
jgi:hypothetical protein